PSPIAGSGRSFDDQATWRSPRNPCERRWPGSSVTRKALQSTGTAWSPSLLRRVADTLRGAASDPAQRDQLLHGRLTNELTAPGFDVFGDARPTGKLKAVKPTKERPARNPRTERDDMMRRRAAELERESRE